MSTADFAEIAGRVQCYCSIDNYLECAELMTGIQFVTDEQGRKVGGPDRPEKTRRHMGRFLGRFCI
jgi:hypothetical protein